MKMSMKKDRTSISIGKNEEKNEEKMK